MNRRVKYTLIAAIVVMASIVTSIPARAEECIPDTNTVVAPAPYLCGPGQWVATTCYFCIGVDTGTIYKIGDCDFNCLYVA